ncbi:cell division protein FtsQ/DivIB [Actinomadura alba]|uniref:cell division protein FtsQ/DivIB n=1 Tax=Actinomadura alba TaxID=406431 RepID=UPI001C9D04AC|nr:FtsQ-type POTRA domain-containing protein [Actinomadura alba]
MTDTGTTTGPARAEPAGDRPPGGAVGPRRPNRWKVICVALLVVCVLTTAAWVLLGSRLLVVRDVHVTGVKILPRDRVVTTARVPLGTPMVRMDTDVIRDRVERLPEVESASVVRRWPATVRIVVRERVPVVVVERAHKFYEMDRYGVIVVTTSRRPAGLPTLMVANPSAADPATAAALRVRGDLPARFARRLAQIEASSPESVTLRFKSGTTVVWGAAERSEEKVRLIDALLATPEGRAARIVDVSSPEVVTTR